MSPTKRQSVEYDQQLAAVGRVFEEANVAAIYCIHGTFVGNDVLGLLTELSRFAPGLSRQLSRVGKSVIDLVAGEAGNFTRQFAADLANGLASGAGREIPIKLFHWSSQNNHIARADGAIRLIDALAQQVESLDASRPHRIQLWGHSHGGNVLALTSQLLGANHDEREEFFRAARSFYQPWVRRSVDMPNWQRVRDILDEQDHPLRKVALDMVTFGTPIRYGWSTDGYSKLLHFIHHRPPTQGEAYHAPIPLKLLRARKGLDGDYVQQIGISGTNFMPLPIFARTLLADWRLDRLLEANVVRENIITRLRHATRVPDDGTTLLVDYTVLDRWLHRHIAGHGLYTKRRWLPFHCQAIAEQFYGTPDIERVCHD